MIVTEDQVSAALNYLGDAALAGEIRYRTTMAENKVKETWARLFLSWNSGPVAEREAKATAHPEYQEAQAVLAANLRDLERHKSKSRSAEMLLEVWRTENANARAAERIR